MVTNITISSAWRKHYNFNDEWFGPIGSFDIWIILKEILLSIAPCIWRKGLDVISIISFI